MLKAVSVVGRGYIVYHETRTELAEEQTPFKRPTQISTDLKKKKEKK